MRRIGSCVGNCLQKLNLWRVISGCNRIRYMYVYTEGALEKDSTSLCAHM